MRKEYSLKIIYDPESDEIDHLSEQLEENVTYVIEVNGQDIPITDEMRQYLLKHSDSTDIGIS